MSRLISRTQSRFARFRYPLILLVYASLPIHLLACPCHAIGDDKGMRQDDMLVRFDEWTVVEYSPAENPYYHCFDTGVCTSGCRVPHPQREEAP
jgi:hypothetical protein